MLTRQIPIQSDTDNNNPTAVIQGNWPIRPVPITPLVTPHQIPQPKYAHPYNGRGILQTPMIDHYNVPGAQSGVSNLVTQSMSQYP